MGSDQKIRVCHLISGDLWAGAEVQVFTLLRQLARHTDIDLSTIVLNEGKLTDELRAAGIDVLVIDESRQGFFQILSKAKKYVSDSSIDIIHSHRRKENVLAGFLKRGGHTRHLVKTVHGAPEPFAGLKWLKEGVYRRLDRYFTNRYFDHILPVSDNLGQMLQHHLKRGRMTTIHNSIDLDRIVPHRPASEVKSELGLDKNQPIIGSAGRMVPVKGHDVFVRSARAILKSAPKTSFVLAGDGPVFDEIKTLADKLGILGGIALPGFRDDIVDVLNCLDIFVISSHHEGIPTVLLEAMALRKPIVSTAVGGIKEVIEDNVSGLLVEPGDPQAIASACLKLLDDNSLKTKLGESARETVENRFSAERQAGKVAKIYHQLMDRTPRE